MVDQLKIGDKIKKARGDAGLTQKELGKKIGITAMGISYLEKGLRKIKVDDIVKIAEQLNVEKSYLLEPITGKPIGNNGSSSTFNLRSDFELEESEKKDTEGKINDAFKDLFKN